jgi:circadian clock protein KaiC
MMTTEEKAKIGIAGLDDILAGGLHRKRVYLVEGQPGTGKTTLALQFLIEGRDRGERVLYFTLAESEEELRHSAASHGWSLDGIEVCQVIPADALLDDSQQQSLLYSSDLELGETTKAIFAKVEAFKPSRVVLDSLSEIRLLAQSSLRYRRQILAMKHRFSQIGTTVLLLDDMTSEALDKTVHSVAHGVFKLEELAQDYGPERRRLRILKYRGQRYRGGYHDFNLAHGGLVVFPALVAAEHKVRFGRDKVGSGINSLDNLLGGGLERGTSALVLGPAGAGKTLMTLTFVVAALKRGENAAIFAFDEDISLLAARAKSLGLDLTPWRENGQLQLLQVDAAELSPGEFAHRVRNSVEKHKASCVLIDSLNGYQLSMPEERYLILHMHELLTYLNRSGIVTFLTVAQHGLVGSAMQSPVDLTYLSDTVILLRYFEARGSVRRAVSVIKKRDGAHENTIRELRISSEGLEVGDALESFQGVLRGAPEFVGQQETLLGKTAS